LGSQDAVDVALAFVACLHLHKLEEGLHRVRAYEGDVKFVALNCRLGQTTVLRLVLLGAQ